MASSQGPSEQSQHQQSQQQPSSTAQTQQQSAQPPSDAMDVDSSTKTQQQQAPKPRDPGPTTAPEPSAPAPASPPLPERHTALTPGPRASRLQEVFDDRLRRTLDKLDWDNFAACYPIAAARAPATLRYLQRQMVERLDAQCRREFASVLEARDVVAKLNELEVLVGEAERRRLGAEGEGRGDRPVAPHLLPARAVLAAHLRPHLAAQQSQLNAKLQTVQAHNARLFDEIRAQRAEAAALIAGVEAVLADVDGANTVMRDAVEELTAEARRAEMAMEGIPVGRE